VAKLVLFLQDGSTLGIILAKERMVIGRRADNDVCLPYPAVSGEHAQVVTIFADSFLEDLGSTNGTLVNGKAVAKHFLRDGDQIEIGRQCLVYLADDTAEVEPLPAPPGGRAETSTAPGRVVKTATDALVAKPKRAPPPARVEDLDELLGSPHDDEMEQPAHATVDTSTLDLPDEVAPLTTPAVTPVPFLKVLSGPNAGRTLELDRDDLSLGRVGVQVARIRKQGGTFRLVPVEGDPPPGVNGAPVGAEGVELRPGDQLEVAGARIEFALPAS
jgi:hypothetical protein